MEQLDAAFEVTVVGRVLRLRGLLAKGQILGLGQCFICHGDVQVPVVALVPCSVTAVYPPWPLVC